MLALAVLTLLANPTDDSVEVAVNFTKECGQILAELCPEELRGLRGFRGILHEGEREITHGEDKLDVLRFDPDYEKNEQMCGIDDDGDDGDELQITWQFRTTQSRISSIYDYHVQYHTRRSAFTS
ncbi:unnamed protein product [Phytophthora lilii]|uniref:Unnamed protein product n=1 Tax=Phytophthora lilii TaxID=2077276 RepID=A0A9W6XFB3_9STRA|nr:unnamed protein product [Phytophthora lilii]